MRTLIAATSLAPAYGGPAVSVSGLARALARAGAEVGLWAADGSAVTTPLLGRTDGLRALGGRLGEAFDTFDPDLVHDNGVWLPHNHRIAALAASRGLPRLVSTRGMLEPWALSHKRWKKSAAWRLYQRRDLQSASALHATAAPEAESFKRLGLSPPAATIPNGMDLPSTSPSPVAGGRERTALFLGRIYPVKGLPMLIEAWARVRPARWRLVVAGPDEAGHRGEVEAAAAAAGLGEAVVFAGPVLGEAKRRLLEEADLFVLPSHSESFGMAVAEALAHAVPVLTTTAVPWPSLEACDCGWRVAPSPDGLGEGLRRAASCDAATLAAMGERGRALIGADFGWDGIAKRFLQLYGGLSRTGARVEGAAA